MSPSLVIRRFGCENDTTSEFQIVGPTATIFGQSEFKLTVVRFGPLSRGVWKAAVVNNEVNDTIYYMAQHITVGPRISMDIKQPGHEDNLYTVGEDLRVRVNVTRNGTVITNSTCTLKGTFIAKADRSVGGSVDATFDDATKEFVIDFGELEYPGTYKVQLFADTEDWSRQTNLQVGSGAGFGAGLRSLRL